VPCEMTGPFQCGEISETGLDYFGARYFSGAQGRFTSPDAPFVDQHPEDPQSWNLYVYGRNNPLRYFDPSGMEAISKEDCQKNPDCVSVPVNVIYDQNAQIFADDGKTVQPQYQAKIDEQLAATQDVYGNALVSFDISYSQGSIVPSSTKAGESEVKGLKTGIYVVVTDSRDSLVPGGSVESNGAALIRINAGTSDRSTLPHEMGHVLAGDTRIPGRGIWGIGTLLNAAFDVRTDFARFGVPYFSPYAGNRFDPLPGQRLPVTSIFNLGARRFRR
jgi:RHS repeat-associated protein